MPSWTCLVETLIKEVESLADKGCACERWVHRLPASCQAQLKLAAEQTAHQQNLEFILP